MLIQINAPHFCAGCELVNGRVTKAAPIVAYMKGWTLAAVREYAIKKRWKVEEIVFNPDYQRQYSATADGRVTPVVIMPKSSSGTSG